MLDPKGKASECMDRKLIINSSPYQTRIALLEQDELCELSIEQRDQSNMVGNIYKGVVSRILPGMNSAFIDIGYSRSAFLFGGDAIDPDQDISDQVDSSNMGDDFLRMRSNKKPIERILKDGQHILVQVSKEPLGTKGPRVTMHVAVPGRYLVYMPKYRHVGVSRKIEDEKERERLKALALELLAQEPTSCGMILRTASKEADSEALKKDFFFLAQVWKKIEQQIFLSKAPSLIYCEFDPVKKVIRDLYDQGMSRIIVDEPEIYEELKEFLTHMSQDALNKLEFYDHLQPIFDAYDIEMDIAKALNSKVDLPSGGYLVIDQTEALTSFDVNTGRFVGKVNARQTILRTNLEAAKKVVEQLRIRNIGGIIIVDFIDMENSEDRESVFLSFQEELKRDRAKNNVLKISDLGLVQMTRKRTSESLERQLTVSCPLCEGRGYQKNIMTESHDLMREIMRTVIQTEKKLIKVKTRTDIKEWVFKHMKDRLLELNKRYGVDVVFETSSFNYSMLRDPSFEVSFRE